MPVATGSGRSNLWVRDATVFRLRHAFTAISLLVIATACGPSDPVRTVALAECDSTRAADPKSGLPEFCDHPQGPVMVELPAGRFLMGSTEKEAVHEVPKHLHHVLAYEKPQVEVEIGYPFAIGKYEVTFAEWDRCVEAGWCSYTPDDEGFGRGDRPVINVNRGDAVEYVLWLREVTGEPYRLPTEAEWEYAARAGTTTARYWGDEVGEGLTVCDGCGSKWDERSTVPVGSFAPNPWGLHDMLGNAGEWVADCWSPDHSDATRDGSARQGIPKSWQDGECTWPVKRGGSWDTFAWAVRSAYRSNFRPGRGPSGRPWSDRTYSSGFRVARDIDEADQPPSSLNSDRSAGPDSPVRGFDLNVGERERPSHPTDQGNVQAPAM